MNPCPRRRMFKSHHQMSHTERRYHGGEVSSVRSGTRVTELRKLFETGPFQFDRSMNKVTSRPFTASFAHPATQERPAHPAHPVHRNHSALPAKHADLYVEYAHSTRPSHCAHHHAHYAHSCLPREDYAHPSRPHPTHLHLAQSRLPRGHRSLYCDPWIYSRSTQEHIYEKVDPIIKLTRMHSSGMRTARLLTVSKHALGKGVSAHGGVCLGGCLPKGVSVWRCVCSGGGCVSQHTMG